MHRLITLGMISLALTACSDLFNDKKDRQGRVIVSGTPEYISRCSYEWLNKVYASYHANGKIEKDGEVYILTNNGMDAKYIPIDQDKLVVEIMAKKQTIINQAGIAAKECAKEQK